MDERDRKFLSGPSSNKLGGVQVIIALIILPFRVERDLKHHLRQCFLISSVRPWALLGKAISNIINNGQLLLV